MDELKELWVAEDRWGNVKLYFSEPFGCEGEWFTSKGGDPMVVSKSIIDGELNYETSPQKVIIKVGN